MNSNLRTIKKIFVLLLPIVAIFFGSLAQVEAQDNQLTLADGQLNGDEVEIGSGMPLYPGDEKWEGKFASADDITAGVISDIAANEEYVYVAGPFAHVGDQNECLGRWDGKQWSPVGGQITGSIEKLAATSNRLYAAGAFSKIGNIDANRVASWDGSQWHPMSLPDLGGGINDISGLAANGNRVYLSVMLWEDHNTYKILEWNGDSWNVIGDHIDGVTVIKVFGQNLYIGGKFTQINGQDYKGIARWDGHQWYAMGSGVEGYVKDIVAKGDRIYVGGDTGNHEGNEITTLFSYWDGSSWHPISGFQNDFTIDSMAVMGDDIYLGADFNPNYQTADRVANGIVRWDGSHLYNLGSGLLYNSARRMVSQGNRLYVKGYFQYAGNKPARDFAIWHSKPEIEMNFDSGAPGSSFLIRGRYFTPGSQLNLFINGQSIPLSNPSGSPEKIQSAAAASFTVNDLGEVVFNLSTPTQAKPGDYSIALKEEGNEDAGVASVGYTLDPEEETHEVVPDPEDPDTPVTAVPIPPEIEPIRYNIFIPVVLKQKP